MEQPHVGGWVISFLLGSGTVAGNLVEVLIGRVLVLVGTGGPDSA